MMIDSQPTNIVENLPQCMKKRIWWSILIRDRSLCIGLRRRPQVTSINMHGYYDSLKEEDFHAELHCSRVYDYDTKRELLIALQEQCSLAVVLTDLVTLVFAPASTTRRCLSFSEFYQDMRKADYIKQSLVKWEVQARPTPPPNASSTRLDEDAAGPLRSLTFMYYQ